MTRRVPAGHARIGVRVSRFQLRFADGWHTEEVHLWIVETAGLR